MAKDAFYKLPKWEHNKLKTGLQLFKPLNDKYFEFFSPSEEDEFVAPLQEVEAWLYEEGKDETKSVYTAKLNDLKKKGDPIEERCKDHMERGGVVQLFNNHVNSFRDAAISADPNFDRIEFSEKQQALNYCSEADAWLKEKKEQYDALPKYATSVSRTADMRKKADEIDRKNTMPPVYILYGLGCHMSLKGDNEPRRAFLMKGLLIPVSTWNLSSKISYSVEKAQGQMDKIDFERSSSMSVFSYPACSKTWDSNTQSLINA